MRRAGDLIWELNYSDHWAKYMKLNSLWRLRT